MALTLATSLFAQSSFVPEGGEYSPTGTLPGDQTFPDVSLSPTGGYVVWQDNVTDGDGLGISAQKLDSDLSGTLSAFRVNQIGAGDQENPRVALLKNGGAAFVWQGGPYGFQHIYARFLNPDGTFATGDLLVNTYTNNQQITPAIAALPDGSAIVVWASDGEDGDKLGVYGQRLSATGQPLGGEFQVNQTTPLNQRSPAVAALANGDFVVTWISESLAGVVNGLPPAGMTPDFSSGHGAEIYAVDVFGRIYDPNGNPVTDEFKANSQPKTCANPAVSGAADGGFAVTWSEYVGTVVTNGVTSTNGWDIAARCFDGQANPKADEFIVNNYTYGDQYSPRLNTVGATHLVAWTSLAQDGSREGVYGQLVTQDGKPVGPEFRVNTTTVSQQFQQAVGSDGSSRFLVAWSSFVGGVGSFDIFAQRYAASSAPPRPAAPYVSALSQSRLSVTWPPLAGYTVDHYEVYADSNPAPAIVTSNSWTMTGLAPSSTHTFQLLYQLSDGERSPRSDTASGTTWGEDLTGPNGIPDGLPDDWEAKYFGPDPTKWPDPNADTDGDGASNFQEFLAGTDPTNPSSVLKQSVTVNSQGAWLNWNTQPGFIYQVESSSDLKSWSNFGNPRFAPGTTDAVTISIGGNMTYYRIIRVR
ncbi:MAG: fibronectin type III domain-containing protein [Verrucomicrobia bacterium]|nr:fibronectin type III domain-containing protein [Verrucomicrobiota bacterium]